MATTTILCKQCNFENEPERVYCHNCGAKLDRSLLPIEAIRRDDPVVVQDRVRKMMSPKRGQGKHIARNLALTLLASLALAAFVQIVRPPREIPNISQDAVMSAPGIRDDMENVLQQPSARRLSYPVDQVNAFLQYSIRSKDESFSASRSNSSGCSCIWRRVPAGSRRSNPSSAIRFMPRTLTPSPSMAASCRRATWAERSDDSRCRGA